MRPDATVQEARVMFAGVADVLNQADEHGGAAWCRYAGLIADGVRGWGRDARGRSGGRARCA